MTNEFALNYEGFKCIPDSEMMEINGGIFPVLFVIWGISVTVGDCLVAGAAIGLVAGGAIALK